MFIKGNKALNHLFCDSETPNLETKISDQTILIGCSYLFNKFHQIKFYQMFIVKKIKTLSTFGSESIPSINYCIFKIDRDGNSSLLGKYNDYKESLRKMKLLQIHSENKQSWKYFLKNDNSFIQNGWDANYTVKITNEIE
jgi:hypothetical protein